MRKEAKLIVSAAGESGWPRPGPPEIAFAGRSNVGKSSLINALLGVRALARVSRTPGKTRLINFYAVEGDRLRFVDLPGYGYAKVSKSERASWHRMIESYMVKRKELAAIVLLVDARRGPQDWEIDLMAWLGEKGLPWVMAMTKADKLNRRDLDGLVRSITRDLGMHPGDYVLTSATKGAGILDLWRRIEALASPR